jgi:hypothetical protein
MNLKAQPEARARASVMTYKSPSARMVLSDTDQTGNFLLVAWLGARFMWVSWEIEQARVRRQTNRLSRQRQATLPKHLRPKQNRPDWGLEDLPLSPAVLNAYKGISGRGSWGTYIYGFGRCLFAIFKRWILTDKGCAI